MLIPVPLHPRRLAARGYNQATLLSAAARAQLPVAQRPPLAPSLLVRTREGLAGRATTARARRHSAEQAFTVPARAAPRVCGRRVILIDDVVTTGATVGACAQALQAAGAKIAALEQDRAHAARKLEIEAFEAETNRMRAMEGRSQA